MGDPNQSTLTAGGDGHQAALSGIVGEHPPGRVGDREGEPSSWAQHPGGLGHREVQVADELQGAEGGEDDVERVVGERQVGRRAEHRRDWCPGLLVEAPRVLELAVGQVQADRTAALLADPPRALTGTRPHLEHVAARHLAEDSRLVLGQPLGTPHEAGIAQELAVGRLVLVGVPVPVRTVRPPGLGLVDRTALDAHGGMCPGFFPVHAAETTGELVRTGPTSENAGMDLTTMTPLSGGWSGETFVAEVAGERSVVRIYAGASHRGTNAHEVDAALLRLVRGLVPVPEVLEVRRADPAADHPALLVTSFLPGVRGDLLLPDLDERGLALLGGRLGRILADLAGMPMLRSGPFVDGNLTIGSYGAEGQSIDGLPEFVALHEQPLQLGL